MRILHRVAAVVLLSVVRTARTLGEIAEDVIEYLDDTAFREDRRR